MARLMDVFIDEAVLVQQDAWICTGTGHDCDSAGGRSTRNGTKGLEKGDYSHEYFRTYHHSGYCLLCR